MSLLLKLFFLGISVLAQSQQEIGKKVTLPVVQALPVPGVSTPQPFVMRTEVGAMWWADYLKTLSTVFITAFFTLGGVWLTQRHGRQMLLQQHVYSEWMKRREEKRDAYIELLQCLDTIEANLQRLLKVEIQLGSGVKDDKLRQFCESRRSNLNEILSASKSQQSRLLAISPLVLSGEAKTLLDLFKKENEDIDETDDVVNLILYEIGLVKKYRPKIITMASSDLCTVSERPSSPN